MFPNATGQSIKVQTKNHSTKKKGKVNSYFLLQILSTTTGFNQGGEFHGSLIIYPLATSPDPISQNNFYHSNEYEENQNINT